MRTYVFVSAEEGWAYNIYFDTCSTAGSLACVNTASPPQKNLPQHS